MSCSTTSRCSTVPIICGQQVELHFAEIKQMLTDLIYKEQVNQLWKLGVESTLHSIWSQVCYQRACVSISCQTDEQLEEDCDISMESSIHINDISQIMREEVNSSPSPSFILLSDDEDSNYNPKGQQDVVDLVLSSSSSAHEIEMPVSDASPEQSIRRVNNSKKPRTSSVRENEMSTSNASSGQPIGLKHVDKFGTSSAHENETSASDASVHQNTMSASYTSSGQPAKRVIKLGLNLVKTYYPHSSSDSRFSRKDEVSLGERTHVQPVTPSSTCDVCSRVFAKSSNLLHHRPFCLELHKETGPFVCPECGKSFPAKDKLRSHSVCHKEKKHKCIVCDKAFHKPSNVTEHMIIHTGAMRCRFCPNRFTSRDDLRNHVRVSHPK